MRAVGEGNSRLRTGWVLLEALMGKTTGIFLYDRLYGIYSIRCLVPACPAEEQLKVLR